MGFVGFPQLATTLHDSPGEGPEGIEAASGLIRLRERQRERERESLPVGISGQRDIES